MFPKNTMATSVDMPKEQPVTGMKETAVVYVIDEKDQQEIQPGSPNKRARIYACAVVLTTLILVTGMLGALAIVFRSTHNLDTAVEVTPDREGQTHDKNSQNSVPDPSTKPRIKIDDGGLWPPINQLPVTPDLVFVKDGKDDTITVGDGEREPIVEGGIDGVSSDDFIIDESSSSAAESSSDYGYRRTYISSSFPYDGFYMRGGVGDPPRRSESDDEEEVISSGSGDGEDQSPDDDMYTPEDEYSPVVPDPDPQDQLSSESSSLSSSSPASDPSSSYSDPYVVSE